MRNIGLFQFISEPPLLRNRKIPWGEGIFFQMENSMEGGIFGLEIPRRGLLKLRPIVWINIWNGVKMLLEIPWEGSKKMRFLNRGGGVRI